MASKLEVRLVLIENDEEIFRTGCWGGDHDAIMLMASIGGRAIQISARMGLLPRYTAGGLAYDSIEAAIAAGHTVQQIADTWRSL